MTTRRDRHVGNDELLLWVAGELPPPLLTAVALHLEQCQPCQERLEHLDALRKEVRATLAVEPPSSATPARERLQMALARELRTQQGHAAPARLHTWLSRISTPAFLLRVCTVVLLLFLALTLRQLTRPLQDLMAAYEDTGPEPDRAITPGSAVPLTVAEVCSRNDEDLDPPVSPDTQRAVFTAYRMDSHKAAAYQIDYLISPQLGGDGSLQNLWPEPYHATVWNATAKDALEARLHRLVCSGQVDLEMAQRDLAGDWIAAYKRYFHTSRPVSTVAAAESVRQP